jgi:hypothetical protein
LGTLWAIQMFLIAINLDAPNDKAELKGARRLRCGDKWLNGPALRMYLPETVALGTLLTDQPSQAERG